MDSTISHIKQKKIPFTLNPTPRAGSPQLRLETLSDKLVRAWNRFEHFTIMLLYNTLFSLKYIDIGGSLQIMGYNQKISTN